MKTTEQLLKEMEEIKVKLGMCASYEIHNLITKAYEIKKELKKRGLK